MSLKIKILNKTFTICKIKNVDEVDFSREFVFLAKTDDELSLVCESNFAPPQRNYSQR